MATNNDKDQTLRDWIFKVIVHTGLRPERAEDIESLLDTVSDEEFSDEQVERILRKAKGKLPLGERQQPAWATEMEDGISEQTRELLALHRKANGELPPEIQRKLKELRDQAAQENEDETDGRIE